MSDSGIAEHQSPAAGPPVRMPFSKKPAPDLGVFPARPIEPHGYSQSRLEGSRRQWQAWAQGEPTHDVLGRRVSDGKWYGPVRHSEQEAQADLDEHLRQVEQAS